MFTYIADMGGGRWCKGAWLCIGAAEMVRKEEV
jgi:hypothetical protein